MATNSSNDNDTDTDNTKKNIKKLIKKVANLTGKTNKEIEKLIEGRKEATHGLLSDYGALYAVAKEFGISLEDEKNIECSKISEIKPQKPCNVIGRVMAVYPPREFNRKDGSSGKFASLLIADDSGECRLVLWNNSADLINKINKGDVLMVRNANCKENLNGNPELHTTSLTHFTVNPKIDTTKLPEFKEKITKIEDIKIEDKSVNLICRVFNYLPPTEFSREDGSSGIRASFIAEDETGKIRVVLWGENAKVELKRGDFVKIENAYAKEGLNQEIELHVGNLGRILKSDEKLNLPELEEIKENIVKINEITSDTTNFTTIARVISIFSQRSYSKGKFASLILADPTGSIRAVLWDDKSNIVNELKRGDAIKLRNVYAKANLNNEPEIHVGKFSEVVILESDDLIPSLEKIEKSLIKDKKINELNTGDRYVRIKGKIVDIDTERRLTYMICPNCKRTIQNLGMGWYCDICGEEVEPQPNLIFSFTIEDETGSIRTVAFREEAEKILGLDLEEVMNIIGETQDETAPIKKVKDSLINTEISLVGRVKYSDFSDQLEFLVTNVNSI